MKDEKDEPPDAPWSGSGKPQDLKERLREYALRIIRLYDSLPKHGAVHVITYQLVRSGTSPGAHYREACRSKSNADFISKMNIALKEARETHYWLRLIRDSELVQTDRLNGLLQEADEIKRIIGAIVHKSRERTSD